MDTCPDCVDVKRRVGHDPNYEIIDIGKEVRALKEFVRLRDTDPAFTDARRNGYIGIPCFVLEDGRVTLNPEDAGVEQRPIAQGNSCRLDGSGC